MDDKKQSDPSLIKTFGEQRHNLEAFARTTGLHKTLTRQTALIVEDDVNFACIVRSQMEGWGFQVAYVTDGVEGIKRIMNEDFSIILCDMLMPNLAGDMFYKAVERVKPQLCKRFIFMTGNQNDKKIIDFIREVRGVIIWKPFKMHILHEAIQAIQKKHGLGTK